MSSTFIWGVEWKQMPFVSVLSFFTLWSMAGDNLASAEARRNSSVGRAARISLPVRETRERDGKVSASSFDLRSEIVLLEHKDLG